jgi:hypothetical protein
MVREYTINNDHEWIIKQYRNALTDKSNCKILWGNRSIWKNDWMVLKKFLKKNNIKTVLEFGSGLSTELMEMEGIKVTCLETLKWWADICRKVINCEIIDYKKDKEIPEINKKFDMVFLDGPQSGGRQLEINYAKKHSDYIYFHDLDAQRLPIIKKEMKGRGYPIDIESYKGHFYKKI